MSKTTKLLTSSTLICLAVLTFSIHKAQAQDFEEPTEHFEETAAPEISPETFEGKILAIIEEGDIEDDLGQRKFQVLSVEITSGADQGETIEIEVGRDFSVFGQPLYKKGDKVFLQKNILPDSSENYVITDYKRYPSLIWLFIAFVIVAIAIGKWRGLTSLIGLAASFTIIFILILPQLASGRNPLFISIVGAFIILSLTLFLAHGFNKRTLISYLGSAISLVITAILAISFTHAASLTGLGSEEVVFLSGHGISVTDFTGLIIGGIIIATVGVLDDVTTTQAATVFELKSLNNNLPWKELYRRAMNVGREHIASVVNTLVLVYAGASLPLLLIFSETGTVSTALNYEIVAEEIVRTLVSSLGLISAVPITTLLASLLANRWQNKNLPKPDRLFRSKPINQS